MVNTKLFLILALLATGCASTSQKIAPKEVRAESLNDVAAATLQEGDATEALVLLEESEKLNPNNPRTHLLYALTYYKKNAPDLAIESAKRAVQLKPDYSEAKNTLGRLLMDNQQPQQAEIYLRQSASDLKFREAYLARTNLGILYYRQGKLDQAKAELTRVIKDEPQAGCVAAYYRGQIHSLENNLSLARKDFETSSKALCASFVAAKLSLGKTLMKQGSNDLARAKLLEIRQLYPETEEAEMATALLKEIP